MANPDSNRSFLLPLSLLQRAKADGFSLERMQEMVRLSARTTHEKGNRRYEDVIFMVTGRKVMDYFIDKPAPPKPVARPVPAPRLCSRPTPRWPKVLR